MKTLHLNSLETRALKLVLEHYFDNGDRLCVPIPTPAMDEKLKLILDELSIDENEMNDEDWYNLTFIGRQSGMYSCSGSKGRMTLNQARRLEKHGYVEIDRYGANRGWKATITDAGRLAIDSYMDRERARTDWKKP